MQADTAAALIVHDLKNALGGLEGELLTLAGQQAPSPEQARQAHARCLALRERFVAFLTVYGFGGALQARPEDESPLDLLDGLCDAGPAVPVTRGARADAPPFWYFDRRLVRLALQAAIHNARRFARCNVTLSARVDHGWLVLSVDDDGPGLNGVDPSTTSTGLGTQLCQAVAAAHTHAGRTGRVTLADRPAADDGALAGARFEMWLP